MIETRRNAVPFGRHSWIEREEVCTDLGQFRRHALAYHLKTGKLVRCKATLPDTYFSIPATTATEHGYLSVRDDGDLEFRPHTDQRLTPVQFRKDYKKKSL